MAISKSSYDYRKLACVLPVIILFGIITISSGGYSRGSGYGSVYLQPTFYNYPRYGFGSVYLTQPYYAPVYYRTYSPYTIAPSYYYSTPGLTRFDLRSYAIPTTPVYTTPSRALFNVDYRYSNVYRLW